MQKNANSKKTPQTDEGQIRAHIGAMLKACRKERGLTLEQIPYEIQISRRAYGAWERAVQLPRLDLLIKLANFYGVPIVAFFELGKAKP